MTEVDWRTPGCKTCQDTRYHKGWHSVECCGAESVRFVDGFPDSGFSVTELADQVVNAPMPKIVEEIVESCNFVRGAPGMEVTGRLCPSRFAALQAGYPAGHF